MNPILKEDPKQIARPQDPTAAKEMPLFFEHGVTGLKESHGYIYEEFLPELRDDKGRKKYKEMSENDDMIGATLNAIKKPLLGVEWDVVANPLDAEGQGVEFMQSVLDDMSHPFSDAINNALTMCEYGWSFLEKVYKRRMGENQTDSSMRSNFDDGYIGLRKLAPRCQSSLQRWEMDANGGIRGMYQWSTYQGVSAYIPISRGLLFRTDTKNGNPEGVSCLRNCYRSYFLKTTLETTEAIGVERDLAGLPVLTVPDEYFNTDNAKMVSSMNVFKQLVRDVKFNEQGGVILPSDTFMDGQGSPTGVKKFELTLLSTSGGKSVNTNEIINRHSLGMARSLLAQFLINSGSGKGSFALSKNDTDIFLKALEYILKGMADVFNRYMVDDLWKLNAFPKETKPTLKAGRVSPTDIAELASFIETLSRAGFHFAGDVETEMDVRQKAGIPSKKENVDAALALAPQQLDLPPTDGEETWSPSKDKKQEENE